MTKTIQIIVSGRVQGVSFRANTLKQAKALKINGWTKNLPDGRVEIWARGNDEQLEQLIAWCKKGSLFARVDDLTINTLKDADLKPGFYITQ